MRFHQGGATLIAAAAVAACGGVAQLPLAAGIGPDPTLPPPERSLLPTVNIAKATGWPANTQPTIIR